MNEMREEISDAELAARLFADAREDSVAVHPAVGGRMRANIERAIAERPRVRAQRRRAAWIAASACAVAAAIAAAFVLAPAQEGRSEPESLAVAPVARGDNESAQLAPSARAPVARGDNESAQLEPSARAPAALDARGSAPRVEPLVRASAEPVALALAPGKSAIVFRDAALIALPIPEVLAGAVELRVNPLPAGETFLVRAGVVMIDVVRSAEFRVTRAGDRVDVAVATGAVRVTNGDEATLVDAGSTWSTEPEPASHALRDRVMRTIDDGCRAKPRAPSTPALDVVPAVAPPTEPAPVAASDSIAAPIPARDAAPQRAVEEERRSLLALAASHLRSGALPSARAIYRELSRSSDSADASLGLYLLARLEALHAHDSAAALAALDELLARFPDHALAAEASASRIEALLDLAHCSEAGAALRDFKGAADLIASSARRYATACDKRDERSPATDH